MRRGAGLVLLPVRDEVGRLAERLAALRAFVRLLARVNVRVLLHVGLLVEALVAVAARERPDVGVDEQVRGERGGALEVLAARATVEESRGRHVRLVVLSQAGRVTERLGTPEKKHVDERIFNVISRAGGPYRVKLCRMYSPS